MARRSPPRDKRRGSSPRQSDSSALRIIGGRWRGRKFSFRAADGLRPTTDRVRETVFNWLMPWTAGARCADLFAGSGALGLEALSRGAAACNFVDTNPDNCRQIETIVSQLEARDSAQVHACSAETFLSQRRSPDTPPLDIVFLDPPFGRDLLAPACSALARGDWLAPDAAIYIESGSDEALPELPDSWCLHRDKVAGSVSYRLFRHQPAAP